MPDISGITVGSVDPSNWDVNGTNVYVEITPTNTANVNGYFYGSIKISDNNNNQIGYNYDSQINFIENYDDDGNPTGIFFGRKFLSFIAPYGYTFTLGDTYIVEFNLINPQSETKTYAFVYGGGEVVLPLSNINPSNPIINENGQIRITWSQVQSATGYTYTVKNGTTLVASGTLPSSTTSLLYPESGAAPIGAYTITLQAFNDTETSAESTIIFDRLFADIPAKFKITTSPSFTISPHEYAVPDVMYEYYEMVPGRADVLTTGSNYLQGKAGLYTFRGVATAGNDQKPTTLHSINGNQATTSLSVALAAPAISSDEAILPNYTSGAIRITLTRPANLLLGESVTYTVTVDTTVRTFTSANASVQVNFPFTADTQGKVMRVKAAAVGVESSEVEGGKLGGNAVVALPVLGSLTLSDNLISWTHNEANSSYEIKLDGVVIEGAVIEESGASRRYIIDPTGLSYDTDYTFTVIAKNSAGQSTESSVTYNRGPAPNSPATGKPVIQGLAREGESLSVDISDIVDANGLGPFSYEWKHSDDSQTILGTEPTYTLVAADAGKQLTVTVSFTDAAGNPESVTSDPTADVVLRNIPPQGGYNIIGNYLEESNLSLSYAALSGSSPITATGYQWFRDGVDIEGATLGGYILTAADVGKMISARISYTYGLDNLTGSFTTAAVGPIAASDKPTVGQVVITGRPNVGQELTADTSSISDANGLTQSQFSYQWMSRPLDENSNTENIPLATSNTYEIKEDDINTFISVKVNYTDDAGYNGSSTSDPFGPIEPAGQPPAAVTDLVANRAGTSNKIAVSWTAPEPAPASYKVEVKEGDGEYTVEYTVIAAENADTSYEYTVASALATTSFTFRVTAVNEFGSTPAESAPVTYFVPTLAVNALPSTITYGASLATLLAPQTNITGATITYTLNNQEVSTYNKDTIEQQITVTATGGGYSASTTVTLPDFTPPSSIVVTPGQNYYNAKFTWAPVAGATRYKYHAAHYRSESITDYNGFIDGVNNTTYEQVIDGYGTLIELYYIEAYDVDYKIAGFSGVFINYIIDDFSIDTPQPTINNTTGLISWSAVENATTYEVLYDGQALPPALSGINIIDNTFQIPTALFQPGGQYNFAVKASGDKGFPPAIAAVTYAPVVPTPTGLSASEANGLVTFSWTAVPGVAYYRGNVFSDFSSASASVSQSTTAVVRGQSYQFNMRAVFNRSYTFNSEVVQESNYATLLYFLDTLPSPSIDTKIRIKYEATTIRNSTYPFLAFSTQFLSDYKVRYDWNIDINNRNIIRDSQPRDDGSSPFSNTSIIRSYSNYTSAGIYRLNNFIGTLYYRPVEGEDWQIDQRGISGVFDPRDITIPLSNPTFSTDPTSAAVGSNITLSWTRPANAAQADTVTYDLFYGSTAITQDLSGTSHTFAFTQPMVSSTFRVVAKLATFPGRNPLTSEATCPAPLLPAPTGLAVDSVVGKTINISFDKIDEIAYNFYLGGVKQNVNNIFTPFDSTKSIVSLTAPAGTRNTTVGLEIVRYIQNENEEYIPTVVSARATAPVTGISIDPPTITVTPVIEGGRGFDITVTAASPDILLGENYLITATAGSYTVSTEASIAQGATYQYRNSDLPPGTYTVSVRVNVDGSTAASQTGLSLPASPATLSSFSALEAVATTQTLGGISVPTVPVQLTASAAPITAPLVTAPAQNNLSAMEEYLNKVIKTSADSSGVFVSNHTLTGQTTGRASIGFVADNTKDAVINTVISGRNVKITIGTKGEGISKQISLNNGMRNVRFGLPNNYKLVFSNFDTTVTSSSDMANAFYKVIMPDSTNPGSYKLVGSDFLAHNIPFCLKLDIEFNHYKFSSRLKYKNIKEDGTLANTRILQDAKRSVSGIPQFYISTTGDLPLLFRQADIVGSFGVITPAKTVYSGYIISNSYNSTLPCFLGSTRIATPAGLRSVDSLTAGDLVLTDDRREVPIRQILTTTTKATAATAPYRFEPGSIAAGYPRKAFEISPDHAIAAPGGWLIPRHAHLAHVKTEQTHVGEEITYYHIELPNYLRDNLVIEGGTVVESYGGTWLAERADKNATPYVLNKANGLFRRAAGISHVKAAGGAGAKHPSAGSK